MTEPILRAGSHMACNLTIRELGEQMVVKDREIRRLRAGIAAADDHPLVLAQGGTDGIDRCHRVINRLSWPDWYWDERCLDFAIESITDAIDGDEEGGIVELRPLHELPPVFVLVGSEGGRYQTFNTREAAEAVRGSDG